MDASKLPIPGVNVVLASTSTGVATDLDGNYKIEVYNNGFKVGEANRPLKKGGLFS